MRLATWTCAAFCLVTTSVASGAVYLEAGSKAFLYRMDEGTLIRTTCPAGTINPTAATCAEDRRETPAAAVFAAVTPHFGGKLDQLNVAARQWSVEIRRVEVKIQELLNAAPGDTGDLPERIATLNDELERLDAKAVDVEEQIALLEERLRTRPDADVLAMLATRREEKRVLDAERQGVGSQLAALRHQLIATLSDFYDPATFEFVVEQRADAIAAYERALRDAAAEQTRRVACERTLTYFGDVGFAFRFRTNDPGSRPTELETTVAVHREHGRAYLAAYTVEIKPSDPHTAFCPGGTGAFCGIRASFKVPVEARLGSVSCTIVGAVSPCYQLQLFKTVDGWGEILSASGGEANWTMSDSPSGIWQLPAQGSWSVVGRCNFVGGSAQHHYPGRLSCQATLREP